MSTNKKENEEYGIYSTSFSLLGWLTPVINNTFPIDQMFIYITAIILSLTCLTLSIISIKNVLQDKNDKLSALWAYVGLVFPVIFLSMIPLSKII